MEEKALVQSDMLNTRGGNNWFFLPPKMWKAKNKEHRQKNKLSEAQGENSSF